MINTRDHHSFQIDNHGFECFRTQKYYGKWFKKAFISLQLLLPFGEVSHRNIHRLGNLYQRNYYLVLVLKNRINIKIRLGSCSGISKMAIKRKVGFCKQLYNSFTQELCYFQQACGRQAIRNMEQLGSADLHNDALFEKIMIHVGLNGKFQARFNYLFNLVFIVFLAMPYLNLVLAMTIPDHWCHVPGREHTNFTLEEWKNITLPR